MNPGDESQQRYENTPRKERGVISPEIGQKIEILIGVVNEWQPAEIMRGPFHDQGIAYWEVETTDHRGAPYLTARALFEMRTP